MKRKTALIASLSVSLAISAAAAFFYMPGVMDIFGKKTKTIEISVVRDESENGPEEAVEIESADSAEQGVEASGGPQDAPASTGQPKNSPQPKEKEEDGTIPEAPQKALPGKPAVSGGEAGKIVDNLVSWGFQESSARKIKAIIVHTSYNALGGDPFDYGKVLQEWKDAGVSPHYAIDRDGTIHRLVADQDIAWHAGVSKLPDGTTDVNGASIGIEVVNSKDAEFTDAEYSALNSLIATLKKKYDIKYVLGHDEIAPGRKSDPWNIEWGKVRE